MAVALASDRRRWQRKTSEQCPWLLDARLRSGTEVRVMDISAGGVQLEAWAQVLPGARVELFLIAESQRYLVKGSVIRCQVAAIVPEEGVRYRAALVFDEPLALLDESLAPVATVVSAADFEAARRSHRAVAVPAPLLLQAAS